MKGFAVQKQFKFGRRKTFDQEKVREKFSDIAMKIITISDIVLEILDARFINETRNLELEKLIRKLGKKIIFVLNKADLVDIKKVKEHLPEDLNPHVFISSRTGRGVNELRTKIKIESKRVKTSSNYIRKHVGIIGYPNTGKSSLINFLMGKKVARTSSEAGFTRGVQKLKLIENILLIDTPGVIPEKEFQHEREMKTGKHAMIGARSYGQVKDPENEVYSIIQKYPGVVQRFYGFRDIDFEEFIEQLGRKKNFIFKGNVVDEERIFRMILKDWQEGKIRIE